MSQEKMLKEKARVTAKGVETYFFCRWHAAVLCVILPADMHFPGYNRCNFFTLIYTFDISVQSPTFYVAC